MRHPNLKLGLCQVTVNECKEEKKIGGAEGDRTLDLCIANAALSQLSYRPTNEGRDCNEAPPYQQARRPSVRDDGPGNRVPFRPMRIRDASPADLQFIVAANTALAAETEGQALDPALLQAGVQAVLEDPSLGRYYMAERNGELLGQLMTTFEWSDWRNGHFLWIQSVYVTAGTSGRRRLPGAVRSSGGGRARELPHLRHPPLRGSGQSERPSRLRAARNASLELRRDGSRLPGPRVPRGGFDVLKAGVEAPDFMLPDSEGRLRRLADLIEGHP